MVLIEKVTKNWKLRGLKLRGLGRNQIITANFIYQNDQCNKINTLGDFGLEVFKEAVCEDENKIEDANKCALVNYDIYATNAEEGVRAYDGSADGANINWVPSPGDGTPKCTYGTDPANKFDCDCSAGQNVAPANVAKSEGMLFDFFESH